MPTQWSSFPVEFRGGLISNLSTLQHGTSAPGSATILQNFEVSKTGGYSKIRGFAKFSTSTVPGTGPILALKVISSGRVIVARKVDQAAIDAETNLASGDLNKTAYYVGTGTTWTLLDDGAVSPTYAVSASTGGGKARHTEFNFDGDDKAVFVDGTNYPAIYNTSGDDLEFLSSSDSTDVSGAEHVAIFKNTAFYAKGNNIFFTAPFTVDDFSAANGAGSLNVGHDVTGLTVFRDQLIIFTTDTIKRLSGNTSADFQMSSITDRIGCINGDTIQEVGGDVVYLAPDGIRLLSATDRIGDFALDVTSDTIKEDADALIDSTSTFSSVLIREKSQYRIFAYVSSEQETSAKGLIATKFVAQGATGISWSTTKGIKAYVADSRYASDAETAMFANNDGYVYTMESGSSFDGSNIEALYESPYMPINDPQVRKTFYKMTLYVEPTGGFDIEAHVKYDLGARSVIQPPVINIETTGDAVAYYGASSSVYGTSSYGGTLDNVYANNVVGSGKTIALRIEDNSTNSTFTLDTALLEFSQNDRQ